MNRNDLIDILTVIQVIDHRTIGEADIIAWGDLIGELPKDLALQAVRDHRREQPGVWLEPGHIVARVRAIRQDRYDRSDIHQRGGYEAICDAKAAEKVTAMVTVLAERKAIPDEPRQFIRRSANELPTPLSVPCRYCHAGPGHWCTAQSTGQPMRQGSGYHPCRADDAAAAKAAAANTATPLCRVCGAHALQAIHETARGICDGCWPSTNGHQQRNDERGTGS